MNKTARENLMQLLEYVNKLKSYISQEAADRKYNIMMFNVPDDAATNNRLRRVVCNILRDILPHFSDIIVVGIYRIGRNVNNRPVIIKFISPRWKHLVFQNKHKWCKHGVKFSYDLSPEERQLRSAIIKFCQQFRPEHARIEDNHVLIDQKQIHLSKNETLERFIKNRLISLFSENPEYEIEEIKITNVHYDDPKVIIKLEFE